MSWSSLYMENQQITAGELPVWTVLGMQTVFGKEVTRELLAEHLIIRFKENRSFLEWYEISLDETRYYQINRVRNGVYIRFGPENDEWIYFLTHSWKHGDYEVDSSAAPGWKPF